MNMLIRSIAALVSLTLTLSVSATSWQDDSHYVALGPRTGYYIVRPGSALSRQLGIEAAPTIDTADPFRHGYGADALAFRFNNAGILSAPPAYIVQATPNEFYTRRLGAFIRGKSRLPDAQAFFGQPQSIQRRPDGFIAITRSRFTTRLKVSVVEEGNDATGSRLNFESVDSRCPDRSLPSHLSLAPRGHLK